MKRQCRTLPISAEHNTGVRIADDSPLPSWLSRFAAQVMNKMRIGKDGKTCEMRRSGRRWRKPMAQFGEKVWFLGEDGVSSFASRMTQGILCGTPWQMVAPELMLTKKVTSDKGGAGPPLPRIVFERAPEVEPRRFHVLSAGAHGHISCPGCAALASHGKATKPHHDECRERIRTIM